MPPEFEFDGHIDLTSGGVSIVLPRPKGWEELATESGVMIAEHFTRLAWVRHDRGDGHFLEIGSGDGLGSGFRCGRAAGRGPQCGARRG